MFHINYKGCTKTYDVLHHGNIPANAVKFDESISEKKLSKKCYMVSAPILIPVLLIGISKFISLNSLPSSDSLPKIIIMDILAILPFFITTFLHELIHCLCFPMKADKEIWIKTSGLFCLLTYCNYPISKFRFIIMNLAPNILLGIFPFILWIFGIFDFNISFSRTIGLIIMILITGGVWDFYNVYLTKKKVPKYAKVIIYSSDFYWFKETKDSN